MGGEVNVRFKLVCGAFRDCMASYFGCAGRGNDDTFHGVIQAGSRPNNGIHALLYDYAGIDGFVLLTACLYF